ncbi:MAG: laccase domain-containing protein, partial [Bacillota bacterium]
ELCRAGIPTGQIFMSGLCTYDNPQLFYSHRRDGPRTGRMLSLIIF